MFPTSHRLWMGSLQPKRFERKDILRKLMNELRLREKCLVLFFLEWGPGYRLSFVAWSWCHWRGWTRNRPPVLPQLTLMEVQCDNQCHPDWWQNGRIRCACYLWPWAAGRVSVLLPRMCLILHMFLSFVESANLGIKWRIFYGTTINAHWYCQASSFLLVIQMLFKTLLPSLKSTPFFWSWVTI